MNFPIKYTACSTTHYRLETETKAWNDVADVDDCEKAYSGSKQSLDIEKNVYLVVSS